MRSSLLVIVTVLAIGCGSDQEPETETAEMSTEQRATTGGESDMAQQDAMEANCPMHVQGTTVQAEHVEGGVALTFVTTGDVVELRERVRNMAATQESQAMSGESQEMGTSETMREGSADAPAAAKSGGVEDGVSAGGMQEHGAAGVTEVEVDTRVEDIEGGARLFLIATSAPDVEVLRLQTEEQAQRMNAGECDMAPHSMQPSGAIVQ